MPISTTTEGLMQRSPRRHPATRVAMLVGVVIGLVLLANLAPQQRPPTPAEVDRPKPARTEVRRRVVIPREPRAPETPPVAVEEAPVVEAPTVEAALDGAAEVIVDVVDVDGRPTDGARVVPVRCLGFRRLDQGRFSAAPGPCELQAVRQDGLLIARGKPRKVELVAGQQAYLQLELGTERTGGVGVRFQRTGMGMRVVHVMPGTAAWEAGLQRGDLIVEVDGVSAVGLPVEAFVDAMTGPEGSEVEFTIEFPSEDPESEEGDVEAETVRVIRGYLEG